MNILATINTGDFMLQNVRESFQDAAARWGCEYVEITEPVGGCEDYWLDIKMSLWKSPGFAGRRVVYFDADVLIRDDCPSPFDAVPAGKFGAVLNDQGEMDGLVLACQRFAWDAFSSFLEAPREYKGVFVNGGMFVFEPDVHGQLFADALRLYECIGLEYGGGDQAALSVVLDAVNAPLHVLDRRWNCVGPIVWTSAPKCPAWVTHFAKYGPFRDGREDKLRSAQWKVSSYDFA